MEKYTQKHLRMLVRTGVAKDITHSDRVEGLTQIGYAAGIYGCNGMLLKDNDGNLYAITSRTTAIYLY